MGSAYKKPVCDCGKELIFEEIYAEHYEYKITSKGAVSKRCRKTSGSEVSPNRLRCLECGNDYEYHYDSKKRIIRGEKF